MDTEKTLHYTINKVSIDLKFLQKKALKAMSFAYVPYSKFPVGAAIIDDKGNISSGCNIENASFGLACCAERVSIFSAISKGSKHIYGIAIVGNTSDAISPCGACRQVIREFAHTDIQILLSNLDTQRRIYSLEELIPYSFGPEHLT